MKKTFLLVFALISLIGLMSFTLDYDQKIRENTEKLVELAGSVNTPPVILTQPPAEIIIHEGNTLEVWVTFASESQANAVLVRDTDEGIRRVERDYSLWVRESKVIITMSDIKVSDEGDYLVEIFNNRGNVFAAFTLVVIPKGK